MEETRFPPKGGKRTQIRSAEIREVVEKVVEPNDDIIEHASRRSHYRNPIRLIAAGSLSLKARLSLIRIRGIQSEMTFAGMIPAG